MRRRNRETAPEAMTPAQIKAAEKLARETLKAGHEAIERYAGEAVPRLAPQDIPAACPESKMDDGAHSGELDGGCSWCGASAAELEGQDA